MKPSGGLKASGGLRQRSALPRVGKRGKRLQRGDRAITELAAAAVCVCCGQRGTDPAHIVRRGAESLRHNLRNILWLCREAHEWLDHTAAGVRCRAEMRRMVEAGGEITPELWRALAHEHGYKQKGE